MNPVTLIFRNKELEEKFHQEEQLTLKDKLLQIIIAFLISSIMGMYFWYSKGNIFFGSVSAVMIVNILLIYYIIIYKEKFSQHITLVIASFSMFASNYQLLMVIIEFDFPKQEQQILQDGIMISMFSFQIHNNFIYNTCQYAIFIIFRTFITFKIEYSIVTSITLIFSIIIIHNDYQRIKNLRNRFLLKEYNNNQLKMLKNLQSPIVILEFQEKSSRLIEYFVNESFKLKIQENNTIQFIKNCLLDRKNNLYTTILQRLQQLGSLNQIQVKCEDKSYSVNSEIYNGQRTLVALEFLIITKRNVQAKPYFYNSLLKYVQKNDQRQYIMEIMKNLCGFLLYRPQKLKLAINIIDINRIIYLANPQLIYSNTDKSEYFRTNVQLLYLFFYILKRCFYVLKLEVIRDQIGYEIIYKFHLIGSLNDRQQMQKQITTKINLLSIIIKLLGLEDLEITNNSCTFTLINLEDKFIFL